MNYVPLTTIDIVSAVVLAIVLTFILYKIID
jgi:hypothetical protein